LKAAFLTISLIIFSSSGTWGTQKYAFIKRPSRRKRKLSEVSLQRGAGVAQHSDCDTGWMTRVRFPIGAWRGLFSLPLHPDHFWGTFILLFNWYGMLFTWR